MSDETRSGFASLPLPLAYHINRVCDHFEAAPGGSASSGRMPGAGWARSSSPTTRS